MRFADILRKDRICTVLLWIVLVNCLKYDILFSSQCDTVAPSTLFSTENKRSVSDGAQKNNNEDVSTENFLLLTDFLAKNEFEIFYNDLEVIFEYHKKKGTFSKKTTLKSFLNMIRIVPSGSMDFSKGFLSSFHQDYIYIDSGTIAIFKELHEKKPQNKNDVNLMLGSMYWILFPLINRCLYDKHFKDHSVKASSKDSWVTYHVLRDQWRSAPYMQTYINTFMEKYGDHVLKPNEEEQNPYRWVFRHMKQWSGLIKDGKKSNHLMKKTIEQALLPLELNDLLQEVIGSFSSDQSNDFQVIWFLDFQEHILSMIFRELSYESMSQFLEDNADQVKKFILNGENALLKDTFERLIKNLMTEESKQYQSYSNFLNEMTIRFGDLQQKETSQKEGVAPSVAMKSKAIEPSTTQKGKGKAIEPSTTQKGTGKAIEGSLKQQGEGKSKAIEPSTTQKGTGKAIELSTTQKGQGIEGSSKQQGEGKNKAIEGSSKQQGEGKSKAIEGSSKPQTKKKPILKKRTIPMDTDYIKMLDSIREKNYKVSSDEHHLAHMKLRELSIKSILNEHEASMALNKCLYYSIFNMGNKFKRETIHVINYELNNLMRKSLEEFAFLSILAQYDFEYEKIPDSEINQFFNDLSKSNAEDNLQGFFKGQGQSDQFSSHLLDEYKDQEQRKMYFDKKYADLKEFIRLNHTQEVNDEEMNKNLKERYLLYKEQLHSFLTAYSNSSEKKQKELSFKSYHDIWERYFAEYHYPLEQVMLDDVLIPLIMTMLGNKYIFHINARYGPSINYQSVLTPHDYKHSPLFANFLKDRNYLKKDPLFCSHWASNYNDIKVADGHFESYTVKRDFPVQVALAIEGVGPQKISQPNIIRSYKDIEKLCSAFKEKGFEVSIQYTDMAHKYVEKKIWNSQGDFLKSYLHGLFVMAFYYNFEIILKPQGTDRVEETEIYS